MRLPAKIDKAALDALPGHYQECYEPAKDSNGNLLEGWFQVQIDPVDNLTLGDFNATMTSLSAARQEVDDLKTRVTPKDVNWRQLRDRVRELESAKAGQGDDVKAQVAAAVAAEKERHDQEVAALKTKTEKAGTTLRKVLVDTAAAKSVGKEGLKLADGVTLAGLLPAIRERAVVHESEEGFEVRIPDGQGGFRYVVPQGQTEPVLMGVEHLLRDLAKGPDFGAFFAANAKAGTGLRSQSAPGVNGGTSYDKPNPWKADSENLTEQLNLQARDPELAKRLQAEAQTYNAELAQAQNATRFQHAGPGFGGMGGSPVPTAGGIMPIRPS